MGIDTNTGYKGSERHGANKQPFKPLRVVLFGEETNPVFCDTRDELRNLGHDVLTKDGSEFSIGDLKKLVKDFDVILPIPTPVKDHTVIPEEPEEIDETGEEELEPEPGEDTPDDMDDNSDEEVDTPDETTVAKPEDLPEKLPE